MRLLTSSKSLSLPLISWYHPTDTASRSSRIEKDGRESKGILLHLVSQPESRPHFCSNCREYVDMLKSATERPLNAANICSNHCWSLDCSFIVVNPASLFVLGWEVYHLTVPSISCHLLALAARKSGSPVLLCTILTHKADQPDANGSSSQRGEKGMCDNTPCWRNETRCEFGLTWVTGTNVKMLRLRHEEY